jgi:GNAT superfamily N-acetyltransferase
VSGAAGGGIRDPEPSDASDPPGVTIRPAADADLPAALAVRWRCDHGPDAEVPAGPANLRGLRHELATGWMAVAEAEGEVVGFAGVVERAGVAMVADLFVDPRRHGMGIGARLLADVLGDRWPRQTFSSAHVYALPLYIRAGMVPRWLALYLRGDPTALPAARGFDTEPATPGALAELERSWGGVTRPLDHAYWASAPGAMPMTVRRGGLPVAFAYLVHGRHGDPSWGISSMSAAPIMDAHGQAAVLATVLRTAAEHAIASVRIVLAGHHAATVPLLRAGWRIEDRDIYVASEPGLLDPLRRVPDSTFA